MGWSGPRADLFPPLPLIPGIFGVLAGQKPVSLPGVSQHPREPLSETGIRVLRYLPASLTAPEIAFSRP
jgi:hypothetical protein